MRIVLTRDADLDLAGITTFTLGHFGQVQADRYLDGLDAFISELPKRRYRLRPVKSKHPGFWRAAYKSHVVFVRVGGDLMTVVRVLHDKMDPENYLPTVPL